MDVHANPQPGAPQAHAVSRLDAWLNEMFRENAMMDEATRFVRQFLRTGGSAGQGANVVILGIMVLFYLWFLATMVRFNLTVTIPLECAELFLVTLVTPGAMYGAISGEREKGTWDALTLTRLTPAQIIVGKMAWRLAIVATIMAVLLVSIVVSQFMGQDPMERPTWAAVVAAQAMILAWGVLLCAYSLWVSSRTKQSVTTVAVVVSSLLGALVLLPSLLTMYGVSTNLGRMYTSFRYLGGVILWSNPFITMISLDGRALRQAEMPPLPPVAWAFLLAALFLLAAAAFIRSAHGGIRRLEEPVRAA